MCHRKRVDNSKDDGQISDQPKKSNSLTEEEKHEAADGNFNFSSSIFPS